MATSQHGAFTTPQLLSTQSSKGPNVQICSGLHKFISPNPTSPAPHVCVYNTPHDVMQDLQHPSHTNIVLCRCHST